jgi:hypothetical protein
MRAVPGAGAESWTGRRVDGGVERQERGSQPVRFHGFMCVWSTAPPVAQRQAPRMHPPQLRNSPQRAVPHGTQAKRCADAPVPSPRSTPGALRIRDSGAGYVCQDRWRWGLPLGASAPRSGLLPWESLAGLLDRVVRQAYRSSVGHDHASDCHNHWMPRKTCETRLHTVGIDQHVVALATHTCVTTLARNMCHLSI